MTDKNTQAVVDRLPSASDDESEECEEEEEEEEDGSTAGTDDEQQHPPLPQQPPQSEEEDDDEESDDSDSDSDSDSDKTPNSPCASVPVVPKPTLANPKQQSPQKTLAKPSSVSLSINKRLLAHDESHTRNIDNVSRSKKMKVSSNGDGQQRLLSGEEFSNAVMEDNTNKQTQQDYWSLYPLLCASLESKDFSYLTQNIGDLKEYVKKMIKGFGEDKARQLEDAWEAIHLMDYKLFAKRGLLISRQAQVVMDSLNTV